MATLLRRGFNIYRTKGLDTLFKKSARYVFDGALTRTASLQVVDEICYRKSAQRLCQRMNEETSLNDVLDTAYNYKGYGPYRSIAPLQKRQEFAELVETVVKHEPKAVMEIGTANGGTLYTWCRHLDSASTILSLDLPGGDFGGGYSHEKTRFFDEFVSDKDLIFIRDDSHKNRTAQKVKDAIPNNGLDFLLIDGDHRYDGVKQDFEMYSPFVSDGGLIAFHDIVPGPTENVGGVPEFWRELKLHYETDEFIADEEDQDGYGVGLLYL